jgi:hypothetical protein
MAAMAPPAYLHGIAVSMYGRFGHRLFAESGVCNARLVAQKRSELSLTVQYGPNLPVQVRSLVANPPETSFVRRMLTSSIC